MIIPYGYFFVYSPLKYLLPRQGAIDEQNNRDQMDLEGSFIPTLCSNRRDYR